MSSHGCKAGTETPAPLVNSIVNNALFHSNALIHQLDAASSHSHPALLSGRLHTELCIKFRSHLDWCQGSSAATNLEVRSSEHDLLLHFRNGGSEWCTDCLSKHSMQTKITSRKKNQNWYCGFATYITKSLQTSKETNNPVYKPRRTSCNGC